MRDLLHDSSDQQQLHVVDNGLVKGLSSRVVQTEEQALIVLFEGDARRRVSSNRLNSNSSRSHCICSLTVQCERFLESNKRLTSAKLNFVDLAGSDERSNALEQAPPQAKMTMTETANINRSLSYLEQVCSSRYKYLCVCAVWMVVISIW